jgi:hypothetical protein
MQAIETVTVGSGGQASIEFTSIPDTYTDLCLLVSVREATTNNAAIIIDINGSSANLSQRWLYGTGSSALSAANSQLFLYQTPSNTAANTFGNGSIYIPNYASTTTAKSISIDSVSEDNATGSYQMINAGLYNSTTAVTAITLRAVGGNIAEHSTATLYGILAGSDGTTTVT